MMEPNWGRGRNQWNTSTWLANPNAPDPQLNTTQVDNIAVIITNTGNITPIIFDPF